MQRASPAPAGLTGLAETAFIPLVARALAAERFPDAGFRDPTAEAIYGALQLDLTAYVGGNASMHGVIARSWMLDQIVGVFTSRHPNAQIVDLGAGLSTRFERIDNGMMTWIDVDQAPVITLRQTLFPHVPRRRMVALDIGSPGWVDRLELAETPTLVVGEGFFVYLEPEVAAATIRDLAAAVPGRPCELAFDYVSPLLVGTPRAHPVLNRLNAARPDGAPVTFRWGARRAADLAPADAGWQVVRTHPVYDKIGFPYPLIDRLVRLCGGGHVHAIAHLARAAQPRPITPPAAEAVPAGAASRTPDAAPPRPAPRALGRLHPAMPRRRV